MAKSPDKTLEELRQILYEVRFHAEAGYNSLERLDILNGYDMAKFRLKNIIDAVEKTDEAKEPWIVK